MSIKVRDFRRELRERGAQPVRQTGTHEIWCVPGGQTLPLVLGSGELSRNVAGTWKRLFKQLGWEWPE